MKTLKILCASGFFLLGFTSMAHAEFGIGVMGDYHLSDSYTYNAGSVSSQSSSSFGVLGFLPVFPWFSFRFGVLNEQLNMSVTNTGGSATTTRFNNMLIPLDLQFDLPASSFYIFGGAVLDFNQSISPSGGSKGSNDTRINLGFGYNIVDVLGFKLSAELEDAVGTHSIIPNETLKLSNNLGLNLLARFTF